MKRESRYITVFRTPKGLMRYKRLVQGISCASEMIQNVVENILSGLERVMNLIDDAFICGKTEEEHDRNLNAVLQRIQDKGLTLNPDKCVFKQTEFEFFGMKFSKDVIIANYGVVHVVTPILTKNVVYQIFHQIFIKIMQLRVVI